MGRVSELQEDRRTDIHEQKGSKDVTANVPFEGHSPLRCIKSISRWGVTLPEQATVHVGSLTGAHEVLSSVVRNENKIWT